jgi:hypothetical protein
MGTQKMITTGATAKLCVTRIVTAKISNALKMTKVLGQTVGGKKRFESFCPLNCMTRNNTMRLSSHL